MVKTKVRKTPENLTFPGFPPIEEQISRYVSLLFPPKVANDFISLYKRSISLMIRYNGKQYAIKRAKEWFFLASRYFLGQVHLDIKDYRFRCVRDPIGRLFPKKFCFILHRVPLTSQRKQCILSVFSCYRLLTCDVDISLDNIISPSKFNHDLFMSQFGLNLSRALDLLKVRLPLDKEDPIFMRRNDLDFRLKGGPNGKVLSSVCYEAKLLLQTKPEFLGSLIYIYALRDIDILKDLKTLSNWDSNASFPRGSLSHLHFISEGGGKTRLIALGDYFSQRALKPIHKVLMKFLRRFPSDGTFSHKDTSKKLQRLLSSGHSAYCFDLSAATDRFPVSVTEHIMKRLFSHPIVHHWFNILKNRHFTSDYHDNLISYSIGQPMGFYTSWSAFTISHHVILLLCGIESGYRDFHLICSKYIMIGDDLSIICPKMASHYIKIIDLLGVQVSKSKSIIPGHFGQVGEIAKRLYFKSEDISPLTPKLFSSYNTLGDFLPLWVEIVERKALSLKWEKLSASLRVLVPPIPYKRLTIFLGFPFGKYQNILVHGHKDNPWSPFSLEEIKRAYVVFLIKRSEKLYSQVFEHRKPLNQIILTQEIVSNYGLSQSDWELHPFLERIKSRDWMYNNLNGLDFSGGLKHNVLLDTIKSLRDMIKPNNAKILIPELNDIKTIFEEEKRLMKFFSFLTVNRKPGDTEIDFIYYTYVKNLTRFAPR